LKEYNFQKLMKSFLEWEIPGWWILDEYAKRIAEK
jgi:hypothetical protein